MANAQTAEVLAAALRRFAAERRDAALLGGMQEDLARAARQLAARTSSASLYLEFPLAGPAHADMGLGLSHEALCLGDDATARWPELAEAFVWAAKEDWLKNMIVAIDGDDLAFGVHPVGLYLKHRGNMAAARDFLCQSGAASLASGYEAAAHRLPKGWLPLYAGNYYERNHGAGQERSKRVVRLEATLEPALCEEYARDVGRMGAELTRLGFPCTDEAIASLSDACEQLLAFGLPATVQLDAHEDGSLADTFGLTLFFTGPRDAQTMLFGPDGLARLALRRLEALGVADNRWQQPIRCSFALPVPFAHKDGTVHVVGATCCPDCIKLKWTKGRLAPARWYQVIQVAALGVVSRVHDLRNP